MRSKYGIQRLRFLQVRLYDGRHKRKVWSLPVLINKEKLKLFKLVIRNEIQRFLASVATDGACCLFYLFKALCHLSNWYSETYLSPKWIIRTIDNGWTDNDRALESIKHFDKYTASRTEGVYRMLI